MATTVNLGVVGSERGVIPLVSRTVEGSCGFGFRYNAKAFACCISGELSLSLVFAWLPIAALNCSMTLGEFKYPSMRSSLRTPKTTAKTRKMTAKIAATTLAIRNVFIIFGILLYTARITIGLPQGGHCWRIRESGFTIHYFI